MEEVPERTREEKDCVMLSWNVTGIWNKGSTFLNYLEDFDMIILMETWLESKDEERIGRKLSGDFEWRFLAARREKKKGRARGGHLVRIRKDVGMNWTFEDWRCGIIMKYTRSGEQGTIISAYCNKGMEVVIKELKETLEVALGTGTGKA
uniref:Endonuclease/exonuclease/phosphatase domain-containing protein n=1 Tax=Strigamia maritima TaxID=126957 RepID=T1JG70_STRMM